MFKNTQNNSNTLRSTYGWNSLLVYLASLDGILIWNIMKLIYHCSYTQKNVSGGIWIHDLFTGTRKTFGNIWRCGLKLIEGNFKLRYTLFNALNLSAQGGAYTVNWFQNCADFG